MMTLPRQDASTAFHSAQRERLSPAVGTVLTGEGQVVFHDVTRYGLHRMCVATTWRYPDVETWMQMLMGRDVLTTRYTEKMIGNVFVGYLWFYWKEGQ